MRRRTFLAINSAFAMLGAREADASASARAGAPIALERLEQHSGGRLGVFAFEVDTPGRVLASRADERFPMCSTFKLLLVAAILARTDAGRERLERRIAFGHGDLLPYAPVTEAHVNVGSMTVAQLCAAAIEHSDNTAANLLLAALGGPAAVTTFARSIGDNTTRLDRREPELNTAIAGDPRDTTSPRAMARAMEALLTRDTLHPRSQRLLRSWLVACETGAERLRAGIPPGLRVGDKTGTGDHGTANDVAIVWPAHRPAIIIAAYLTGSPLTDDGRNAVLANVGRIAVAQILR